MRKRLVLAITVVMVVNLALTGCKGGSEKDPMLKQSKKELVETIYTQLDEMGTLYEEIEEKETLLKGIQDEEMPSAAISSMNDGTGRLTFNSFRDMIHFPEPFDYPGSTQISNVTSVQLSNSLKITPTSNWTFKLIGTTLELEHVSGVVGTIKVGEITEVYKRDDLQEDVFTPFFGGFPPETIKYSKIFLDETWRGLQAMTATTVDNEPAYLRAGMVGLGGQSFVYMFLYDGEKDDEKDEIIQNILKTTKMSGQEIRIEQ